MICRITLYHLELNAQHEGDNFFLIFIYYRMCFISYTLDFKLKLKMGAFAKLTFSKLKLVKMALAKFSESLYFAHPK